MIKNSKIDKIGRAVFVFRAENSFFRPKSRNYSSYKKCMKLAHFLPSFEYVRVNHDENGPSLHDGGFRL